VTRGVPPTLRQILFRDRDEHVDEVQDEATLVVRRDERHCCDPYEQHNKQPEAALVENSEQESHAVPMAVVNPRCFA
jgi:hypothetical protein